MFQKHETHHNTDEQVREYVEKALDLVDDLGPPDDLRGLVFANAVSLFSAKQITLEQVGVVPSLVPNQRH